jgi:predicted dehydrogenase
MKDDGKINIGIIGYGKMGQIRKRTLDEFENCRVKWVCDINEKHGDFNFTKDPNEIFKDDSIQAVFICTPNYLIKDLVVRGLDCKKHIFAEKPPGTSVADVEEMIKAERRNPGCKLKFGFNHRLHDSVLEAKRRIESGELGKILWMRGRYGKSVDKNYKNTWRAKKEYAGGGIFIDQGIHMLDLFLNFCEDFEEVKSFVSDLYWKLGIEDNVFAIFRNSKGQVASLHSTMTQWRYLFALEIFLEKGYIVIDGILSSSMNYAPEVLSIALNRSLPPQATHSREERIQYNVDLSWKREIEEFIDAIENGNSIRVGSSKDALKLMRLVEKVYKDGR